MGLFGFGQAHAGLREQYRLDRNTHDMPADSITGSTPSWLLEQLRHSQPDRPSIKAEDLIFGRLMTVPFHRSGSNQNSFNPVFEEGRPFEINMVSHIRDRSAQDLDLRLYKYTPPANQRAHRHRTSTTKIYNPTGAAQPHPPLLADPDRNPRHPDIHAYTQQRYIIPTNNPPSTSDKRSPET
ncbi:unnamed protein product [Clonostachys rosea f. rosea IK726]|uniref:Uncharacterized protein n=1 Tax=Clonostachys rosea f. rosea IK726 TaxID=1349383 RepID=A0ACA9UDA5_BIOOC|nr:unnamed protein product [Clonostachys rosea f. rosea IK726]